VYVGKVLNDVTMIQYNGNKQTNDQKINIVYENIMLIKDGLFNVEPNNEFMNKFIIK